MSQTAKKNNLSLSADQTGNLSFTDEIYDNHEKVKEPAWHFVKYLLMGMVFGIVLLKSEVISWYRIQEMFRLQSFHMYGVIGSAVVTGAICVFLIKKFKVRTIYGDPVRIADKTFHKGQVIGGLIFGFGWALTGACPGPLFALIGGGISVVIAALLSAIAGTWVYGALKNKLPD